MTGIAIEDATIVLTGASSGIGRATAHALAQRGARLALAARSTSDLEEVSDECRRRGGDPLVVTTDVGDDAQVEALATRAIEHFGHFDAWVNCAAVMAYGRFWELPNPTFRHVIETNLFGTVHGSQMALEHFLERDHGVLVNVDSLYGRITSPYVSPYVTSKFAIRGFTRCLRQETASFDGIDVCAILPEAVDTPIFDHAANYTGHEITALPPAVAPRRAVRTIVDTLESPRPEQIVGIAGRFMAWGEALAPGLYERVAHRFFDMIALRPDPVPDSHGNVFCPMSGNNQIGGGWRAERRGLRRGAAVALAATALSGLAWLSRHHHG